MTRATYATMEFGCTALRKRRYASTKKYTPGPAKNIARNSEPERVAARLPVIRAAPHQQHENVPHDPQRRDGDDEIRAARQLIHQWFSLVCARP